MAFCGYLKQSTTVTIMLGPFVDDGDGKTAETGLTIEDTDIYLSKNGGAFANPNDTDNASHDASGYYTKQLDGTDTGTLGLLTVECHESGALLVRQDYQVVTAHWYDTMCSTDYLHVDMIQVEGSAAGETMGTAFATILANYDGPTKAEMDAAHDLLATEAKQDTIDTVVDAIKAVTDNLPNSGALTDLATAANLTTVDTVVDAIKAVTDNLPNSGALTDLATAANLTTVDTVVDAIKAVTDNLPNSGALTDLATAAALVTVDTVVDAIKAKTDNLPADPADDSDIDTQLAAIAGYIDTEITTIDTVVDAIKAVTDNLPNSGALTDLATAANLTTVDTVVDAIKVVTDKLADTLEDDSGTYRFTENALEEGPGGGAGSLDLNEALADHDTEDTLGNVLNDLVEESGGTYRFTSGALGQAPTGGAGSGAVSFTYTLISSVDSSAIVGASVWVTSDEAGNNLLASGTTDSDGEVTFQLDTGTVYVWRYKPGWNFSNPDEETVS